MCVQAAEMQIFGVAANYFHYLPGRLHTDDDSIIVHSYYIEFMVCAHPLTVFIVSVYLLMH